MSSDDLETLRRELAWQPILGGGLRGLGYGDVDGLALPAAVALHAWAGARREQEWAQYWKGHAALLGSLFRR